MNTLSKILIVAFIILSLHSISARDTRSIDEPLQSVDVQDHTDSISTDGIVTVADNFEYQGTGFFIGPHTLVTAFHVIDGLEGKVSDNLFIKHPVTGRWIPVHSIQAFLPGMYDFAVLHISEYESPVYYELFEGSEESLASSAAYLFDHEENSFSKIEGTLSPQYHFEIDYEKTLNLFSDTRLAGLSGSPIFSIDNKVIGLLTRTGSGESCAFPTNQAVFPHIKTVQELLLKPSLNCQSANCLNEEVNKILDQYRSNSY